MKFAVMAILVLISIGNAIEIPSAKATPEQINAFVEKAKPEEIKAFQDVLKKDALLSLKREEKQRRANTEKDENIQLLENRIFSAFTVTSKGHDQYEQMLKDIKELGWAGQKGVDVLFKVADRLIDNHNYTPELATAIGNTGTSQGLSYLIKQVDTNTDSFIAGRCLRALTANIDNQSDKEKEAVHLRIKKYLKSEKVHNQEDAIYALMSYCDASSIQIVEDKKKETEQNKNLTQEDKKRILYSCDWALKMMAKNKENERLLNLSY